MTGKKQLVAGLVILGGIDLQTLRDASKRYTKEQGQLPQKLDDLISAKLPFFLYGYCLSELMSNTLPVI